MENKEKAVFIPSSEVNEFSTDFKFLYNFD